MDVKEYVDLVNRALAGDKEAKKEMGKVQVEMNQKMKEEKESYKPKKKVFSGSKKSKKKKEEEEIDGYKVDEEFPED